VDDLITQIGVGGIFAVLLIDRVLKFVKDWRAQDAAVPNVVEATRTGPHTALGDRKLDDLHRVIEARDDDGVPRVYTPRRHSFLLEELIVLTRESENTQTELLKAVNLNTSAVNHLRDAVNHLNKVDTGTPSGVHVAADRKRA
jgi:hypothetical protein